MPHALAFGALVWTSLGIASPRSTPPRDPAAAEALFEQGRRALEKNDLATACAKFAESQKLDPGVGTLMNWATCEERQGRIATAWQRWREALSQLPADDDRVAFAQQHVESLEPKLPRLTIALALGAPADTQVQRDGVVLGRASLGTALPVDPGVRSIIVLAPGFESRSFQLPIAEGESKRVEVAPGRRYPAAPEGGAAAPSASHRRTIGWALIGVGAAGAITGIVTGLMLDAKRDEVDSNCFADGCNQAGLDAASDGKTLLVVNAVGWGTGVAGLGAGVFMVLSSPQTPNSTVGALLLPRSPSVGVTASPRGFGVGYRSRF